MLTRVCDRSSKVEQPAQRENDGSIPIRSLHVSEADFSEIYSCLKQWHYMRGSCGGARTRCFKVEFKGTVVGAAVFGLPWSESAQRKYGGKKKLLELRRFCLADACEKNSESRVIGVMLRKLRRQGFQRILSYADPNYGHVGTIYKATGFQLIGKTMDRKHVLWNGKQYHNRYYCPHNPNIKACEKAVTEAVKSGRAKQIKVSGKFIYLRDFGAPVKITMNEAAFRRLQHSAKQSLGAAC